MTETTFEQGDKDALAFIDTEDIIKHLEDLGYQVVDKSEHGDVLQQLKLARDEISNYEDFNDNEWWQASHVSIDFKS
ncbi:MAG: hypothetical protein CMK92_06385 [Pseudomonas sp.]|nr:hypothetical protein [Pseudomonas sp.]|tara:strand:- start:2510 stop:2740 length:231 start_codon:yes stop_codon:yes gene_type:complete